MKRVHGGAVGAIRNQDNAPHVQEHTDLITGIRTGKPLNELKAVAESTLTAVMGRMAAYTGKTVTWEKALNSQEDLMAQAAGTSHRLTSWDVSVKSAPVAVPGKTALVYGDWSPVAGSTEGPFSLTAEGAFLPKVT